ncbi:redoxin family protein [Aliiglaciecola sp. 3_MG-2023]|uniref:redoxin domain-containing protein n=1 Tax=Aliiglaciecola sp. 3_MG-2023 TaxID=3062644 RepID=UPI0026E24668|nr:redoxin domain-containing protein [Aliiglaciecola sp. 3_MG-2023]MDO6695291.1 redoxin family protein [Aliiglaciecola sp. 3_MG-2023]
MTNLVKLIPGSPFPSINAALLDGSTVNLGQAHSGADWQMLVVYRGKHCPLCVRYLNLLEEHKEALNAIGVSVTAVSADSKEQLSQNMEVLNVTYPIAYGLSVEQMQQLGLYISAPRSEKETDHDFSEPALFVINEVGVLQGVNIANTPFLRPELDVVVRGLTFVRNQTGYPIRGTQTY